jgi:SAM-dependent methyltransferase
VRRLTLPRPIQECSILDVGFGTAAWIEFWLAEGAVHITGIDLTEVALEQAQARFPELDFVRGDIAAVKPPLSGAFDVISAMNVFLHIVDDAAFGRAIANVGRLLAPGGILLVMDPVSVCRRVDSPIGPDVTSRSRTVSTWDRLLRENGLVLLDLKPATVVLGSPIEAADRLRTRLALRLWFGFTRLIRGSETRARLVCEPLVWADEVLTRVLPHGPSAKCLVARRSPHS